jgi:hypothetical protein
MCGRHPDSPALNEHDAKDSAKEGALENMVLRTVARQQAVETKHNGRRLTPNRLKKAPSELMKRNARSEAGALDT